jgi:hypothetical protein
MFYCFHRSIRISGSLIGHNFVKVSNDSFRPAFTASRTQRLQSLYVPYICNGLFSVQPFPALQYNKLVCKILHLFYSRCTRLARC